MFDFRLQVFHAVAKRLNFTKAAEELYITQPAVTKHIHEIENHFKVTLFERNGTKIKLTPAGEVLLHYTDQVFEVYRKLEFELNSFNQQHTGTLKIGASTTVAQYILPPLLATFHKKFKKVRIALAINNTEQIEKALQENNIELGIIEGHSKNKLLKYIEFTKDELVLVANAHHPITKRDSIKLEELTKIPLLLREPGSGTLEVIAHALKPLGIKISQLQNEMQLGSTESMKLYLLNSDALAFLSVHAISKEIKNKECSIVKVNGLKIERTIYFVQRHGQHGTLPELFMRFARHHNPG